MVLEAQHEASEIRGDARVRGDSRQQEDPLRPGIAGQLLGRRLAPVASVDEAPQHERREFVLGHPVQEILVLLEVALSGRVILRDPGVPRPEDPMLQRMLGWPRKAPEKNRPQDQNDGSHVCGV